MARLSRGAAGAHAARRLRICRKFVARPRLRRSRVTSPSPARAPVDGSRATAAPQFPSSARWATRWSRGSIVSDDVVADDRLASERVELRAEHRAQAAVRAREVVVQRAFEPRPRARLGRVADDVRRECAVRIAAEVERLAVHLPPPVRGEHRSVGGADEAALDLELRDALDCVVLPRGEVACRPRLPVRRADDERADQRQRDERDPADLGVHRARASARFETSRRPASMTKFATTLEPP